MMNNAPAYFYILPSTPTAGEIRTAMLSIDPYTPLVMSKVTGRVIDATDADDSDEWVGML